MSQKEPGEEPPHDERFEKEGEEPDNPYQSPMQDDERRRASPPATGTRFALTAFEITFVVILLVVVVGFGLLVGCCSIAGG